MTGKNGAGAEQVVEQKEGLTEDNPSAEQLFCHSHTACEPWRMLPQLH